MADPGKAMGIRRLVNLAKLFPALILLQVGSDQAPLKIMVGFFFFSLLVDIFLCCCQQHLYTILGCPAVWLTWKKLRGLDLHCSDLIGNSKGLVVKICELLAVANCSAKLVRLSVKNAEKLYIFTPDKTQEPPSWQLTGF